MSDKLFQLKHYPYFYTDGTEIYSFVNNKFRKLNGWKQTYLYRQKYCIKPSLNPFNKLNIIYRDELKNYINNNGAL
jgi:hypothetical protein